MSDHSSPDTEQALLPLGVVIAALKKGHPILGPDDIDLAAAAWLERLSSGRLTFCERCETNRIHLRAEIVNGVQMFECPVCAVSRPDSLAADEPRGKQS